MRNSASGYLAAKCIAAATLCFIAATPLLGEEPPRAFAEIKKPRPRLRLSREVTFFTVPLAKDGLVDYAAAMNARYEDVTKENNAAVALVEMLGQGDSDANEFAKLCKRLDIVEPVNSAASFVHIEKFVEKLQLEFAGDEEITARRLKTTRDVLRKQLEGADWSEILDRCSARSWSAADEPVISAWLDQWEKPLAKFEEVTRRTRYYIPSVSDDTFSGMLGTSSLTMRTLMIVKMLQTRAMRSLGAGDVDAAWKDVMTIRRWSGLVCDPKPIIDQVLSMFFMQYANASACIIAVDGKLSSAEIKKRHEEWKSVSAMPNMQEAMELGERCFALDMMNTLNRVALHPAWFRGADGILEPFPEEVVESPWRRVAIDAVLDWNAAYETVNLHYDELTDIAKLPTGRKRTAAAVAFEDKIERIAAAQANPFQWFTIAVLDHGTRRRALARHLIAGRLMSASMPVIVHVFDSEDRVRVHRELVDVTFALARYRAAKGTYPVRLAELVPTLLEKPPQDLLGEGQLQYKRLSECEFELYSVGSNGKDDGGKTETPLVDTTPDRDETDAGDFEDADDLVIRVGPPRS